MFGHYTDDGEGAVLTIILCAVAIIGMCVLASLGYAKTGSETECMIVKVTDKTISEHKEHGIVGRVPVVTTVTDYNIWFNDNELQSVRVNKDVFYDTDVGDYITVQVESDYNKDEAEMSYEYSAPLEMIEPEDVTDSINFKITVAKKEQVDDNKYLQTRYYVTFDEASNNIDDIFGSNPVRIDKNVYNELQENDTIPMRRMYLYDTILENNPVRYVIVNE